MTAISAPSVMKDLLAKTDLALNDPLRRNDLIDAGYTDELHARFTAWFTGGSGVPIHPYQLSAILSPLQVYLGRVIEKSETEMSRLSQETERITSKVTTLRPDKPNKNLEQLQSTHNRAAFGHLARIDEAKKFIHAISITIEHPATSQRDPAFVPHGMDA